MDGLTRIFSLDGKLIYSGENPETHVEKGTPVIMTKDGQSRKVIF